MFGPAGDVTDDDSGRGAGDAGHVVMLSQPVTMVAPAFGMLGKIERVVKSLSGVATFADRGKIENGKAHQERGDE